MLLSEQVKIVTDKPAPFSIVYGPADDPARHAFVVPVVPCKDGPGKQGRKPARFGAIFFYHETRPLCVIVVGDSAAKYMHQRRYARYIGRVKVGDKVNGKTTADRFTDADMAIPTAD